MTKFAPNGQRIVWQPLPGTQTLGLIAPVRHLLLDGTRGGGKTDVQLMRVRSRVGLGYGPFWRSIVFDREYKQLDDMISKSLRWFPEFDDGARFAGGANPRWTWPTGEQLLFRHIKRPEHYWLYHGHEYPSINWNELTKYPTSELYDLMMSCNRTSFVPSEHPVYDEDTGEEYFLPEIPLEVVSTTNPFGAGHNWVRRRFIDVAPPGVVSRTVTKGVMNPRTQREEDVVESQVRLFSSFRENRFLTPEYIAGLMKITDPNKRKAWLFGDWNVVAGGMFDDTWNDEMLLPDFNVPQSWRVDRSFDWGSSHPFWVGWWAEASGEEAKRKDGSTFCPPRGSLILINEWYGTKEIGTNAGLKLSAKKVAIGIKEREAQMRASGLIRTKVLPGPADGQIYDVREEDVETIAYKMEQEGIFWERADKSPGSRINGAQLVRERMEAARDGEGPGLFVVRSRGAASIEIIPTLPRDEVHIDDVDTTAEDHPYDGWRYRVLAGESKRIVTVKTQRPR